MPFKVNFKQVIPKLEVMSRKLSTAMVQGAYKSSFHGEGVDFYEYQPYGEGDSAKKIDWKTSVRVGQLVRKEFVEERNNNVCFVVDTSSKMVTGVGSKLKAEYAAELVSLLASLVVKASDRPGFIAFNKDIVQYIKPSQMSSNDTVYWLRKTLVDTNNYKKGCDLAKALKMVTGTVSEGSLVFVVSDFIGLNDRDRRALRVAMNKFDVVGLIIKDMIDIEIPEYKMNLVMESTKSNDQFTVNPKEVAERYRKYTLEDLRNVIMLFKNNRSDVSVFVTEEPFMPQLRRLFDLRKKKM